MSARLVLPCNQFKTENSPFIKYYHNIDNWLLKIIFCLCPSSLAVPGLDWKHFQALLWLTHSDGEILGILSVHLSGDSSQLLRHSLVTFCHLQKLSSLEREFSVESLRRFVSLLSLETGNWLDGSLAKRWLCNVMYNDVQSMSKITFYYTIRVS